MGWAYCGEDKYGREIGYGIEATCDKRGCEAEINRGLGCCCGEMHGGERGGCGRYYCDDHLGWVGERGSCQHRGTKAWGRTKCQLLSADHRKRKIKVADGYEYVYERLYYCACHEWTYGGPALAEWDPRKGEDPYLENPRLVTGFMVHVQERGFASEMRGTEDEPVAI